MVPMQELDVAELRGTPDAASLPAFPTISNIGRLRRHCNLCLPTLNRFCESGALFLIAHLKLFHQANYPPLSVTVPMILLLDESGCFSGC
jgi:hypothetical protein